jgi:NAD(P)-dependent dehydrogenase (short-subunit alcohol dehydrogenase family)
LENNATALSFRLDGQVGIVTGGANGIGRALGEGLAQAGASVVLADLPSQADRAQEVVQIIEARGGQADSAEMDVTSLSDIQQVVARVATKQGRLDFLVNNAGINIRKPVLDYSEEDWDRIEAVNLKAVFFCCQVAGRQMASQGGGRIVNIVSQLAVVAMSERSIYAITKAGVSQLTRAFALELGPRGVAVNAVGPTFVATPMTTSMFSDPAFVEENLPRIPSGRFGTPRDVLGAVQFLLSPAADLVNGQTLLVDGGYTAQ